MADIPVGVGLNCNRSGTGSIGLHLIFNMTCTEKRRTGRESDLEEVRYLKVSGSTNVLDDNQTGAQVLKF